MIARRLFIPPLAALAVAGCVTTDFYRFNTRVPMVAVAERATVYAKVGETMGDSVGAVLKGDTLQGVGLTVTKHGRYSREGHCLILYNGDTAFVSALAIKTLKEPGAEQRATPGVEQLKGSGAGE